MLDTFVEKRNIVAMLKGLTDKYTTAGSTRKLENLDLLDIIYKSDGIYIPEKMKTAQQFSSKSCC